MSADRPLLDLPVIDPGMVPQSTEQAIVAAGANVGPHVTPEHIASLIQHEYYFTAADGVAGNEDADRPAHNSPVWQPLRQLTFCVLALRNGYTVAGQSFCVSSAKFDRFDAENGRRKAREQAVGKLCDAEGYVLRQRLHEGFKS